MTTTTESVEIKISPDASYTHMRVPVRSVRYDPSIQRPLEHHRADKIAAEFSALSFGTPVLSWRDGDAGIFVVDGWTRLNGLMQAMGPSATRAVREQIDRLMPERNQGPMCAVWTGLTHEDEARMFAGLNTSNKVSYLARLHVRVTAGDQTAIAVVDLAHKYMWQIPLKATPLDGNISAAGALEKAYLLNPGAADSTLFTVTNAWCYTRQGPKLTRDAVNGTILEGLSLVYHRYGEAVDRNHMVSRLSLTGGPMVLLGQARQLAQMSRRRSVYALAEILVNNYNIGIRKLSNRLEPWQDRIR